jgi:hypothetical protein
MTEIAEQQFINPGIKKSEKSDQIPNIKQVSFRKEH